jgi:hypothetical protein
MQRVSECELVVFCGAAARLRRAAAPRWGGGQPAGLAAAPDRSAPLGRSGQNLSPFRRFLIANRSKIGFLGEGS